MNHSLAFARTFFFLLGILFFTSYAVASSPEHELTPMTLIFGIGLGSVFGLFLIGLETLFRRYHLRGLTTTALGLFLGYWLGFAVLEIFETVFRLSGLNAEPATISFLSVSIYLSSIYLAVMMTVRAAEEITISLPFLRLTPRTERKKDLIIDNTALQDVRLIDLANSGIIDNQLVVPRMIVKDAYNHLDSADDTSKTRARRAIETLKKLETNPALNLRYDETDLTDVKDAGERLIRLARLTDANILTGETSRINTAGQDGVRYISLNALANALKPVTQAGETIEIKVQRNGKEPRQGVGYLEDGTMVVINGGGDLLGQTIRAQVLSVKHTSSGRMVFCNACENETSQESKPELVGAGSSSKHQ